MGDRHGIVIQTANKTVGVAVTPGPGRAAFGKGDFEKALKKVASAKPSKSSKP